MLRDVLAFTAEETAEILDSTVASVNSAFSGRGRPSSARRPDPSDVAADPQDAGQRDLLRRYVTAFETHESRAEGDHARGRGGSMPPFAWRLTGAEAIAAVMGASDSCAGARLVPCRMNGTQGFGQYRPGDGGVLRPFALVAVEIRAGGSPRW